MTQRKRGTISDLAARLGVSSMTVHRAIAGKPDISPETRRRILAEIERLGWRPNMAARGLRQGKTFTLGILVSDVSASFLPQVLQGVDRAAEEQGYHTFVSVHEHDPARAEKHLRTIQSKGVDGIVHYPTESGREVDTLNEIYESIPIVAVMRELAGFKGPTILVDDRLGGRLAAEHLLQLGHERIGFLGYRNNSFSADRRAGFEDALLSAGLRPRAEWIAETLEPGSPGNLDAARRFIAGPDRPSAVFCASDRIAARILQAAAALGSRVPGELSVVGFNNDPWTPLLFPPLTTVAQPRVEVGQQAAEVALDAGASRNGASSGDDSENGNGACHLPAPQAVRKKSVLEPRLVVRDSTAPSRAS